MVELPELLNELIKCWEHVIAYFADSRSGIHANAFVVDSVEYELSNDRSMCGRLKLLSIVVSDCEYFCYYLVFDFYDSVSVHVIFIDQFCGGGCCNVIFVNNVLTEFLCFSCYNLSKNCFCYC